MRVIVACILSLVSLPARSDAVDNVIHDAMTQAHIPGAAVAIVRDGRITRISSYGIANSEYGIAAMPTTAFQIASATKLYTSVLLMRLVEQHKLNLEDSVGKYIHDAPASWKDITVRNLATWYPRTAAVGADTG
jgi:CubicO group peptidase (beta-lactamase class C family)